MTHAASLRHAIAALTSIAELPQEFRLHPLPGAGNNRVFRVDAQGRAAVLKIYFRHPDDARDRGHSEFSFSTFAWDNNINCVARPLAYDEVNGLGLYEFVEGRQVSQAEITEQMIDQTVSFFKALNRHKSIPAAARLPLASEACFSLASHLRCVDGRVHRLEALKVASGLDRQALELIGELRCFWDEVAASVKERMAELRLDAEHEIPWAERCLSPSDFGFHNAILDVDGRLRFIDFEYAGWDDPARMLCDFFCQPAIPVPPVFFERFVEGIGSDRGESSRERIAILQPVYQVKWCCVLMNEFLPVGRARRNFGVTEESEVERQGSQLNKARLALRTATADYRRRSEA